MAFPETGVLDDFNRADENPLGNGNWSGPIVAAEGQLQLLVNQAAGTAGFSGSYWSASTFGPDTEVYCTMAVESADLTVTQLWLRLSGPDTATPDGYFIQALENAAGTDQWQYYRVDDGALTQLGATEEVEIVAGDVIGLRMVGSTLQAFLNGVEVGTGRTDATYTAAGNVGLRGNNTTYRADDFGGGALVQPHFEFRVPAFA